MIKGERKALIYDYLVEVSFATVDELSEKFYASRASIRRDLTELETLGLVKRSWGSARVISSPSGVTPFGQRSYNAADKKRLIAKKAAELLSGGMIIFLDQSSTSYFLAVEIMSASPMTVVTNNLEILSLLSHSSHTVISSGGSLSGENRNCLLGGAAVRSFSEIFADFAFFSTKALSEDGVISDCTSEEVFLRNCMLKNAKTKVFLCDSTKFRTRSSFKQCELSDVDVIISDSPLPRSLKDSAKNVTML
ncbi:MAG: DeoR/GlpR transcriptional regulator [Clostridia bacterium]|nr:DeoR/GlpR transcriptional regulator [Clostridia bacterium]